MLPLPAPLLKKKGGNDAKLMNTCDGLSFAKNVSGNVRIVFPG
jgi:hypothetical protein